MGFIKFVFMVVFFPLTIVFYGTKAVIVVVKLPFRIIGAFVKAHK